MKREVLYANGFYILDGESIDANQGRLLCGGEDGWLYPPTARICPCAGRFAVFDETGWDGFKKQPNFLVGFFNSWEEAYKEASKIIE